ncbi:MAG: large conductance mechanosensitive channel protein MscL [Eggerthellaceae bacterium]|nr:large conductance mechanosensitive channel protein MscL [Eggerthellaceae bacterium]
MSKGRGFIKEFKDFINRGNVMDMAVGVIIGAAFTAIVTSLTDNIINPFISLITGGNGTKISGLAIPVNDSQSIDFGAFISAILNFLIVALCVFLIVKAFNRMKDGGKLVRRKDGVEEVEMAPVCPFCKEEVNVGATRCYHCAADLPAPAEVTFEEA